jgi:hypothetical protein
LFTAVLQSESCRLFGYTQADLTALILK